MASQLVDERSPLLTKIHEQRPINDGQFLTGISDFDAAPENPLNWQPRFKWGIVALLSLTSFTVTFTCMATIPLMRHIARDLDDIQAPPSAAVLPVTIWELGEAVGPLLIGPLSEMAGRYAVMNVTNSLFILFTALTAFSQTMPLFIASRAFTGLAVASNVLNPAIIGDMFAPEQRGTAMSLIMFAPLLGSTVGPVLGGFLLPTLGWRCVVWVSTALATICELAFYAFFRETYSVVIIRRRNQKQLARTTSDFDRPSATWRFGESSAELWSSMKRPAGVLFSSGLLSAVALFGAIIFSQSYVVSVTLPIILEDTYGLSPAAIGSAFLAQGIGTLIGLLICKFGLDRVYMSLREANDGIGQPEYRLPMAVIGTFMLPPATALYGWCAANTFPLALFLVSIVCLYISILLIILSLMAYVVDAAPLYAASAMTGVVVLRCLAATGLPLSMTPLVESLGYGWGFSSLAGLDLVLVLVPLLAQRHGHRWRRRSKYTRAL